MKDTAGDRLFSTPSNRVPIEIWANIFLKCLPQQRYTQPNPWNAPMLLCQVNRGWRSTALSLSALWSSISVESSDNGDIEKQVEGLGTWLGRSGARPLAISCSLVDDKINRNPGPVWDLIVSFIGRWEDLRLTLERPPCGSANILFLGAPLLKRFEGSFGFQAGDMMRRLFTASPRLTDFVWSDISRNAFVPLHIVEFTLLWSQLTRFTTNFISTEDSFTMLRLCPNLIECTFKCISISKPPHVLIVHQHLRALNIYCSRIDQFLDRLTLPALCALSIRPDYYSHDSFPAFLSRSGCTLKTFRFYHPVVPCGQLMDVLCLLPALTELSIEGSRFDALGDALFHSLTYDETAGGLCLCPNLRVIFLRGTRSLPKGIVHVAKMLESRYRLGSAPSQIARLQKATLYVWGYRDDVRIEHLKELATIRDMGLDVVVEMDSAPCMTFQVHV